MKMRSLILFLSFLSVLAGSSKNITLSDALKKGVVTASFNGYQDSSRSIYSSHYGKSMLMKIQNTGSEQLNIELESGFQLIPLMDAEFQKMVVTASEIMILKSKQTLEKPLFSMCCESGDGSPTLTSEYALGGMVEPKLLGLVKLIEKNHLQDYAGQSAVWVLTDDKSIHNVLSGDTLKCSLLRKYLCEVKGLDFKDYDLKIQDNFGNEENQLIIQNPVAHTFASSIEYINLKETTATLVIIDESDQVVETLFENRNLRIGKYNYTVELTTSLYSTGKIYYLRLFAAGRVAVEKSIMVSKN